MENPFTAPYCHNIVDLIADLVYNKLINLISKYAPKKTKKLISTFVELRNSKTHQNSGIKEKIK